MTAMLEEIHETPAVVARLLADGADETAAAAAAIRTSAPRWVAIAGRGTSDNAAVYGRYLFETQLGIATGLSAPSVSTVYDAPLDWRGGVVIGISQSGESPDVVEVVQRARAGGGLTVAVTNEPGSPLARAAEHVLWCRAGTERSLAATKTYTAQLVALAALVAQVAEGPGPVTRGDTGTARGAPLRTRLGLLPGAVTAALDTVGSWAGLNAMADEFAATDRALLVSRGHNLATALETALKLKETANSFADGYSTADLEHGPVALAGPGVPVLAFRPDGAIGARMDASLDRVRRFGARPWTIGGQELADAHGSRPPRACPIPLDLPEALTPVAYAVAGQLLAEAVAVRRGRNPDSPQGLTKVTLT
jgi:glucosamine--fructose-6-phosphate aminotransferase (isomerizing)